MQLLRALLIDDEPDVAAALSFLLEPEWRVRICTDPRAAIAILEDESYDIVITDLLMPQATGAEVLAAIKKLENAPPVVISTGLSTTDSHVQAVASRGAAAVIQKPFLNFSKVKDLLTKIAKEHAAEAAKAGLKNHRRRNAEA